MAEHFPDRLLAWWDRHGRKDLPWQHPRSPYRVWISEVMLQQTQVSTVIGYFDRWIKRFPEISELALAEIDDVLALWSGLGYYARARNLHETAGICVERFDGNLPDDFDSLNELPGIGPSTANAILSLAYNQPAAILDGNVKRLLARHACVEGWPGAASVQRLLWREAEERLPKDRAADYSQAIMDLGSMVCTAKNPVCKQCPVAEDCRALLTATVSRIPAPRPRKKIPKRKIHVIILVDSEGRVLLERRPPSGIWGGLWSLPEGESRLKTREKIGLTETLGVQSQCSLPEHHHRLTHLHMILKPEQVTLSAESTLEYDSVRENDEVAWFDRDQFEQLGLPKPIVTLLNTLQPETIQ